jgi:hypothetical protein
LDNLLRSACSFQLEIIEQRLLNPIQSTTELAPEEETETNYNTKKLSFDRIALFVRVLQDAGFKVDKKFAWQFFGLEKEISRGTYSSSESRMGIKFKTKLEAFADAVKILAASVESDSETKKKLKKLLEDREVI